jgi:hypothetical protein
MLTGVLCSLNLQSLIKLYQEVIVYKKVRTFFYVAFISIFSPLTLAAPTYDVFSDNFGTDWTSQPWGATVTIMTPTSPATAFRGTKSAKVEFTSSMGVFKPVATGGFKTLGYKHLIFAVYNQSNADDLWLVAQNTNGVLGKYLKVADYADKWNLPQGKWSWVRIPINDLGLSYDPTISFFSVASGKAGSVAYFDDVGFAASSVLYEGMKDSSYAPGIQLWHWNGIITEYSSSVVMTTSSAWGGMQFQHRVANLNTSDYGAVAIRIKTADLNKPNQFGVNLTDKNGATIGKAIILDKSRLPALVDVTKNDWFHFTIKMSEFGVSSATPVGGLIIWAAEPTKFEIDDVRFVQKLNWVMDIARSINDLYGSHWQSEFCDSPKYRKLHNGVDYAAAGGQKVYSASRGVVKQVHNQSGGWGYAVVIQHESGFTTSYLHLDTPSVTGDSGEVQKGALLGKTAAIAGPHLHFGLRVADYDGINSQAGMMPEKSCTIGGTNYPAFPANFLDSKQIDWNPK